MFTIRTSLPLRAAWFVLTASFLLNGNLTLTASGEPATEGGSSAASPSDLQTEKPLKTGGQPVAEPPPLPSLPPATPGAAAPDLQPLPTPPLPATPATAPGALTAPSPSATAGIAPQPSSRPAATAPFIPSAAPESLVPPTTTQPGAAEAELPRGHIQDVLVTADLDLTREKIAPSLGATSYTIGPNQIQTTPQGEQANFDQILLRAPGVVQDSFGQVHVRGEHNNLTFRVNGVLLPEGLNGFGQELDTRLVSSTTLITGSLPAQFGFRTAGIIDVTTKSGSTLNHNEFSLYGGSYDTVQPSLQLGGTSGKLDYFFVGSYNHNNLGIENSTSSTDPIHDRTDQQRLFGYLSYHIDDTSRLSVLLNASNADFQIPATAGITPTFTLAGNSRPQSGRTDENQNEQDYYTVVSYQKTEGDISFLAAGFSRFGQIHFLPDPVNDPIFTGVASRERNTFATNGVQFDLSDALDERHTLRGGFQSSYTSESLDTRTGVFQVDASGGQTSDTTFYISDNSGNFVIESGLYLQDEWKLTNRLTLNYGLRYDRFDASFENADQISPRANLVWKVDDLTTAHIGYSRYFAPPPPQFVLERTLRKFVGTSNEPSTFRDDPTRVERSHYFDLGITRELAPNWQVDVDGFYKDARHLNDLGQFGSAIILSPYAYRVGHVEGGEVSSTYKVGSLSLFGNFAYVATGARGIESSQYLFGADERAYIATHDVHLDHQANYTASAGASYRWKNDLVYVDLLYGSGLRSGFANTSKQPSYIPVNIGYEHSFHPEVRGLHDVRFRFDVINLFDQVYELRNGSGIGVGAPQFGERRAFLAGLTFDF